MLGQWCRYTDDDCIRFGKPRKISSDRESAACNHCSNAFIGDVLDITFAGGQGIDFGLVHVQSEAGEASGIKSQDERETNVAKANHRNVGSTALDLFFEIQAVVYR